MIYRNLFAFIALIWLQISSFSQTYFQQTVNYRINVELNDKRHELSAFESITYINNSPDTLHYLFFHVWPNGYSSNSTALAKQLFAINGKQRLFDDPEYKGYIDSLDFIVNGNKVVWNLLPGKPDICKILLSKPLNPADSIIITTPFRVKIPRQTSRLGHDGQSYQISQWYPKPAVYDKNGWNYMPYLDQGEFYGEFGSYDVNITLPRNYIVGACGNLQNPEEISLLNTLAGDTSLSSFGRGFPASSNQTKTLYYTANHVHDFAWIADKRFHVRKSSVKHPYSGREITTWAMFTNHQEGIWRRAVTYIDSAILYFSKLVGDYPYDSYVVVQSAIGAGQGMEYPALAVIGNVDDNYELDEVIAHENCHNWFYSALGSNERRFPFMDEGITSAYESRYMNKHYPGKKLWEVYFKNRKLADFFHISSLPVQRMQELEWLVQARNNLDEPVDLSSTDYNSLNYSIIIYNKAAMCFNYLRAYLGDSLFDAAMQDYYRRWQSKHPQPADLKRVFEDHVHKDLAWFFNDLLGTSKRLDYQVLQYKEKEVLVKNNGELISPFVIAGMIGDSVVFEKWVPGFSGKQWISVPEGSYTALMIDPKHVMPERNRLNNNIRTSGVFRKADPVKVQLLFTFDEPDKRYLMYIPSISWTRESGLMPGVTIFNSVLLSRPVEYTLSPFFALKHFDVAGAGQIKFTAIPYNSVIRMATVSLDASQFAAPGDQNFHKIRAGLDVYLRNSSSVNPFKHKVFINLISASDLNKINNAEKADMRIYAQLGYTLNKETTYNPLYLSTCFEWNKFYNKAFVEMNYTLSYNGKHRGLDFRLFAGKMLKNESPVPFYALAMGGRSGGELYLYQDFYPDRFNTSSKTFLSRQMTISEGGLVSTINDSLGFRKRLVSLSLTSSLPGKAGIIPLKPFVTVLLSDKGSRKGYDSWVFYEVGVKTGIWNFFEVYFPLLTSPNIRAINKPFKNNVRFVLKLDSFFPVKLKPKTL